MTYRSEVVGSLLRPAYLVEARQKYENGQMSAAEFKAIEDEKRKLELVASVAREVWGTA